MKNLFNSIKLERPRNNVFDLTHDVKFAFNMGKLVPICCMEAVPGDKFHIGCESLLRFAPLISPVMHRMNVTMHYYFVPNRILWPNWENFITGTLDPNTGLKPVYPYANVSAAKWVDGGLLDYMGIPKPIAPNTEKISVMPFAAYQKIFTDYYRDQNLYPENWAVLTDGDHSADISNDTSQDGSWLSTLRERAWEHDYFTAALPFAQKGASVDIPLGDVHLKDTFPMSPGLLKNSITGDPTAAGTVKSVAPTGEFAVDSGAIEAAVYDPDGSLEVDATTINDLRRAYKLQEWLERNARGGTRYIENILAHFGVKSSDKRLQRAEYITGTKSPVIISEIVNTGGDSAELPQGNMSGHGLSVSSGKVGSYYCEEHGYIIGIMSVMPTTAYQQGIPKHFLKTEDQFQYYWPSFAHIGEQEVLNKEVYAFQGDVTGPQTFGYVPRYAEYKYQPSRVAGDFRGNLDFWHLGRIFDSPPALSSEFICCEPRDDIFAVTDPDTQHLYAHVLNRIKAVRPMPKFGTPHM